MRKRAFNLHKILEKRILTESTFILKMERNNLEFVAGQHIQVGPANGIYTREYSIYNAPHDNFIEILVKEVEDGLVTPALKKLQKDDSVVINNAVGYFTIDKSVANDKQFLFIASGTGISPFHSFVKSYANLNYKLIHGVRYGHEAYECGDYAPDSYVCCSTRDTEGDFHGRVSAWLEQNHVTSGTLCYLCGNCDMIHDVYDILKKQGINSRDIFSEVYF